MKHFTHILTFLGTAGGAVWLSFLFNRNKQQIEIQNLVGKTYSDMIKEMRLEIERQKSKIEALEAKHGFFLNRIKDLEIEIQELRRAA